MDSDPEEAVQEHKLRKPTIEFILWTQTNHFPSNKRRHRVDLFCFVPVSHNNQTCYIDDLLYILTLHFAS